MDWNGQNGGELGLSTTTPDQQAAAHLRLLKSTLAAPTFLNACHPHQFPDTSPPQTANRKNPVIAQVIRDALDLLAFHQAAQHVLGLRPSSVMPLRCVKVG